MLLTLLRRFLFVACGIYLGIVMAMMILETRLVYPAPVYRDFQPGPGELEITCVSADGTTVHGLLLDGPPNRPAIIIFHGNAEDIPRVTREFARNMRDRLEATVLVFDYRGYGLTGGVPDEQNVVEDGVAMVHAFAAIKKTTPDQLVFFGRSLGGGIATAVAVRTGAGMLMLDRTFEALDTAAAANYPWIPTRLVMHNHYRCGQNLQHLNLPLFQSHFVSDEITPFSDAEKLYQDCPAPIKQFVRLTGGTHLSPIPEEWWSPAKSFLELHAPRIQ